MEDEFGIGDRVLVGTQIGTITQYGYYVKFTDEDGFPFERWFNESDVHKARSH